MDDYSLLVKDFGPKTLFKEIKDARGNKVKISQYKNIQISRVANENKNLPFFLKSFNKLFLTYNPQSSLMKKVIQNLPDKNFYEIEYVPTRGKNVGEITIVNFFNKRIVQWLSNIAYIKNKKIIKRQSLENFWADISYDTLGLEGGVDFKSGKKPLELIKRLVNIGSLGNKDSVILDFFAGSGTTGEAVLELNKIYNGHRQFILCTNNENNICTNICYPRIRNAIYGYRKKSGLDGNLKYFKTDFVDYDKPTDKNKIRLTKQAAEMLCIKEGTFEKVINNERFKIFKSLDHYTGIIWDQLSITEFKNSIKEIKGKFSVYVFSLTDETFDEEFQDMKQKVELSPIPESILRVYRRIFK
jgi:adenine-specific DNA-methyltransferase